MKIYNYSEMKYLLLPQDQKAIKDAMLNDRFTNNMIIEILDKRQAEFDEMTKYCVTGEAKLYMWKMQNGLIESEPELCSDEELINPLHEENERSESQWLQNNLIK